MAKKDKQYYNKSIKLASISFTRPDFDAYQHLKAQRNMSQYVIKLIKRDMGEGSETVSTEMIKKLIRDELAQVNSPNNNSKVKKDILDAIKDVGDFY